MIRSLTGCALSLLLLARAVSAQPAPARLRVFLECDCFQSYLREQITWVDFVRQPQDADVHILSRRSETGGGGGELVLRMVGIGRFEGVDHDLRVLSLTAEPENSRRANVYRTIVVGLLDYLAHEGLPAGLDVDVEPDPLLTVAQEPVRDPWNLWVFRVSSGASIDAEQSNREARWNVNASADRVTANWKLGFGARSDQRRERFNLDEEDDEEPFEVSRGERSVDWFIARSLGPHWSFGFDGRVESSTFGNTKFSAQSAPAVEFSLFPYREYATRQFVIQYQVGLERAKYTEVTVFGKLEETLARQELSANLDQRQPWGTMRAGVNWSQYLHDLSKYRLDVNGQLSLRIVRGLSLNMDGRASRIRNQISLPRRAATPEEVLLELRQLQSGYQVRFNVSVSYSFGSLFNNIVNPRFGN